MSSYATDADPVRQALPVLIAVCVAVTLVGAVYFLAEYRSRSNAATGATQPTWVNPGVPPEPLEANGIEGIMIKKGFIVTALDGQARGFGLQIGDVVSSVGGRPVRSQLDLAQIAPGVTVQTEREGEPLKMTIGNAAAFRPVDVRTVDARGLNGQLTPEGLWVTSVEGDAATWGLRAGDLVRAVDGNALTVRRDATMRLRALDPRAGFVFEIVRDGSRLFLPYNTQALSQQPAGQMPLPGNGQAFPTSLAAPQAAAGIAPWSGAPGAPRWAGLSCPACGAFHNHGWNRGTCWRCGSLLGPPGGASIPAAGAGLGFPSAPTAPVGPCGQVPQRFQDGWAGTYPGAGR